MAGTMSSFFQNYGRYQAEGSFDLSSAAAVLPLSYPAGQTKTVRGRGMTVTKTGTGQYNVVIQTSNSTGGPVLNIVEFADGAAKVIGATLGAATTARLGGIPTIDSNGNINVTILTTTGATNTDTTVAITVSFYITLIIFRMDQAL